MDGIFRHPTLVNLSEVVPKLPAADKLILEGFLIGLSAKVPPVEKKSA